MGASHQGRSTTAIVTAVCAMFAIVAMASCAARPAAATDPEPFGKPAITGEPAGFDGADMSFATTMPAYQQQEIDASELVAGRAGEPGIADLASDILARSQSDAATMKVLIVQWRENPDSQVDSDAGRAPPQGPIDAAAIQRLNSLAGKAFDELWLQLMLAHHRAAIDETHAETGHGGHYVDAVGLATRIRWALQEESNRIRLLGTGSQPG
jgi:uncharacterized protein (DUF305 family)